MLQIRVEKTQSASATYTSTHACVMPVRISEPRGYCTAACKLPNIRSSSSCGRSGCGKTRSNISISRRIPDDQACQIADSRGAPEACRANSSCIAILRSRTLSLRRFLS